MSLFQLLLSIGLPQRRPPLTSGTPTTVYRDWDQIAPSWWYRVTGQYEIHVKRDDDLGWEILCLECAQPTSRPVFRKDLAQAFDVATNLFTQYDRLVTSTRILN